MFQLRKKFNIHLCFVISFKKWVCWSKCCLKYFKILPMSLKSSSFILLLYSLKILTSMYFAQIHICILKPIYRKSTRLIFCNLSWIMKIWSSLVFSSLEVSIADAFWKIRKLHCMFYIPVHFAMLQKFSKCEVNAWLFKFDHFTATQIFREIKFWWIQTV